MNIGRIILGIFLGAIFSCASFFILAYFDVNEDHSSTLLGPASGFRVLGIVTASIIGAIIGGISGAIIIGFRLNIFNALIFGATVNFLIAYLGAEAQGWEKVPMYKIYALIFVGAVNALIVSLINFWQKVPSDDFMSIINIQK